METGIIIATFLLFAAFALCIADSIRSKRTCYFNGRDNHKTVEFKVRKIDIVLNSNNEEVCLYTVVASFFDRKNNRGFRYNTFAFYDEVGKYNLNDRFVLTNLKDVVASKSEI